MRDSVRAAFVGFTEALEGGVSWLYADVRGLVTIAYGNLVDPMSAALGLPFVDAATGVAAPRDQIAAQWQAVKNDRDAARYGHLYARKLTTIRLTLDGMRTLALGKLDSNDAALAARYQDWDDYPACAQLALHSLAWACGAAYRFPRLDEAVRARDWDAASVHVQMRETTPDGVVNAGLRPRNVRNRILMRNADRVQAFHLDPDLLDWTHDLSVADVPTVPSLPEATPIVHDPAMYRLDQTPADED